PSLVYPSALSAYRNSFGDHYYSKQSLARTRAYLLSNLRHDTLPMIVHYEDRGAMRYSVEERFPFLDFRLLEWTLRLPTSFLVSCGFTTPLMPAAVAKLLPDKVRERTTKLGFVTPTKSWTGALLSRHEVRSAVARGATSWLVRPQTVRALLDGSLQRRHAPFS